MLKQTVGWWLCVCGGGDIGRGCLMTIKLQSHKNFQRSAHKTVPAVNKQRIGASLEELVHYMQGFQCILFINRTRK